MDGRPGRAGATAPNRSAALRAGVEFTIYTPGSQAGVPINIVGSLQAPTDAATPRPSATRSRATSPGCSGWSAIDADPLSSREHILLSNLIADAWAAGAASTCRHWSGWCSKPPMRKLGVVRTRPVLPGRRIARRSPCGSTGSWPHRRSRRGRAGEPLDIESMLHTTDGTAAVRDRDDRAPRPTRSASSSRRSCCRKLVTWMRRQSGTTDLRALLYMDEVAGYLPPTANAADEEADHDADEAGACVRRRRGAVDAEPGRRRLQGALQRRHLDDRPPADRARQGSGCSTACRAPPAASTSTAVGDTIAGLAKREFVLRRAGRRPARGVHDPLGDELPARPADARTRSSACNPPPHNQLRRHRHRPPIPPLGRPPRLRPRRAPSARGRRHRSCHPSPPGSACGGSPPACRGSPTSAATPPGRPGNRGSSPRPTCATTRRRPTSCSTRRCRPALPAVRGDRPHPRRVDRPRPGPPHDGRPAVGVLSPRRRRHRRHQDVEAGGTGTDRPAGARGRAHDQRQQGTEAVLAAERDRRAVRRPLRDGRHRRGSGEEGRGHDEAGREGIEARRPARCGVGPGGGGGRAGQGTQARQLAARRRGRGRRDLRLEPRGGRPCRPGRRPCHAHLRRQARRRGRRPGGTHRAAARRSRRPLAAELAAIDAASSASAAAITTIAVPLERTDVKVRELLLCGCRCPKPISDRS